MGLRLRIAILLLLPLALLAGLAQLLLRWDMDRNVAALERTEATSDLHRVQAAFEGQAQNLSGVLGSWANWTALYDHMRRPDPAFRADELSPDALAVAGLDWLALQNLEGRLIDVVEVPQRDGTRPAMQELSRRAGHYEAYFALIGLEKGCGLTRTPDRMALVCYSPARNSEGRGEAVGLVMVGRWVDSAMLAQMEKQIGRAFDLTLAPEDVSPARPPRTGPLFAEDAPTIAGSAGDLTLSVPVVGLFGHRLGELTMTWARHDAADAAERLVNSQRAMVLLVVASGALLVLLLDQLVVKRLARLRHELAAVMDAGNWHGAVTQHGRDEIGELAGFFNRLLQVVSRQVDELRDLSTTDALTGLPNRRAFDQRLNYLLARRARRATPAALIVLDVDHFKRYNDTLGHPAGDEALREIARCLQRAVRRELDLPARIGGEEFGVLLEDADRDGALACAESIRAAVEAAAVAHPDGVDRPHVSISLGVAAFRADETAQALYQRADHALYTSKQGGRNRVTLAD